MIAPMRRTTVRSGRRRNNETPRVPEAAELLAFRVDDFEQAIKQFQVFPVLRRLWLKRATELGVLADRGHPFAHRLRLIQKAIAMMSQRRFVNGPDRDKLDGAIAMAVPAITETSRAA